MSRKSYLYYYLALLTPFLVSFSLKEELEPLLMPLSSLQEYIQNDPQLFQFWSSLTEEQQAALKNQLGQFECESLLKAKALIQNPPLPSAETLEAFDDFAFAGNEKDKTEGQRMLREGRLGCLLLAGGQGTRLKVQGPKGLYPISVIKNKTLFQLCAEKVAAASRLAGRPLQLAIMTSPENDGDTEAYFKENDYFGLSPNQVDFFIQGTLPFLDSNGNLFLETPWKVCTGPDGNGHCLLKFMQSGIWHKWKKLGIEYLHVILVDNPLADPFDPELLGFHARQNVEITLKCTEKCHAEEKVGVLVKQNGHWGVIEYSELAKEEKWAQRDDGRLKHCCGNLSLFCFSMSFIERMALENRSLPLHKAWKTARYVDENGLTRTSTEAMAWKFETFIFDWLTYTDQVAALLYPREECFAPLKNLTGTDSPDTVRQALQARDKAVIQALTGLPPPEFPFELAADFYYPTEELQNQWRGRKVATSYVESHP